MREVNRWTYAIKSLFFFSYLSLGAERRRLLNLKYHNAKFITTYSIDLWKKQEDACIRATNNFNKYKVFSKEQEKGQIVEPFHSTLKSLPEMSEFKNFKEGMKKNLLLTIRTTKLNNKLLRQCGSRELWQ